MTDSILLYALLLSPLLICRGANFTCIRSTGSKKWGLYTFLGIFQDIVIAAVLWISVIFSPYFIPFTIVVLLFTVIDTLLYTSLQIHMKLSFLRYILSIRQFLSSALSEGLLRIAAIAVIGIISFLSLLLLIEKPEFNLFFLSLALISLIPLIASLMNKHKAGMYEFHSFWIRELFARGSGIRSTYQGLPFIPTNEEYILLSEKYPLYRITKNYHGIQSAPFKRVQDQKPHVVIVSMESFRAKDIGAYGSTFGATPNFDNLCNEGVLYTNFHACGIPTGRSLLGTLYGIYPKLDPKMLLESNPTYPLLGLPTVLKGKGWSTCYIQSGDLSFQNYDSFLSLHHYPGKHSLFPLRF